MKKFLLLVIIFAFVALMGCTSIRQFSIQASEEDLKNAETTRIVAKNLLSTWNINYGMIMGLVDDKIPKIYLDYMKELKDYADRKDTLTDYELSYTLGRRVRLLSEGVIKAIKTYVPDALKFLGPLLAL